MARIRTIKPDFWTDERIVELSPMARLFFIGMWNFADDHGGIERGARQLKMKILPGDDVDTEPLIQELIRSGMVTEYEAAGTPYLNIKNFLRHQRINRPSPQRIPSFKESTRGGITEDSVSTRGGLSEDSCPEGKGSGREVEVEVERKGRDYVPSERAALRAEESNKPSLETIPATEEPMKPIQQTEPIQPKAAPVITVENVEEIIQAELAVSKAKRQSAAEDKSRQRSNVMEYKFAGKRF